MAVFPEMIQYVDPQKEIPVSERQLLRQPKLGWCARVCLDIAVAYALQKTIKNLNTVNPNLTRKVTFNKGKRNEYKRNILIGGFAEQIYNSPSQWRNGGLFVFNETDINNSVRTVMAKNNLWTRPDGTRRLAPVFVEHKSGTITSKLDRMVAFLEEFTPTTIGISYNSLRVCFLQFVRLDGSARHECIACGTNLFDRTQNPNPIPMVDIYNPWGNIAKKVNPNDLYLSEKTKLENVEKEIKKIFYLGNDLPIDHKLETVRLFSFKWWK